ncbi:MAG: MFS transporter [Candidatus Riflebacteria bacterium]|nr:MFS transporter [Candidatus Riflebacteria bacterium]
MSNRWIILAAGVVMQTILGGIYAWSTFTPWLELSHGISKGQSASIFGLTIAVFALVMNLAGRVLTKRGPRFTASIGAVLFMCGYLFASFSNGSFPLLMLSLGLVVGAGIAFGYVCPLSVGMKWFPERKGLVTGVAVAGFGGGAVILSSVSQHFILGGMEVLEFFRLYGLLTGIALLVSASFLADPAPRKRIPKGKGKEEVYSVPFAIIMLGMFAGTFAGLLIVGNLAPLGIKAGLSEGQAVSAVAIFAIGNAIGRVVWGQMFDYLSYRCIPLSLGCFSIFSLLLLLPLPVWMLLLTIGLLGFCFGANFVVYASTISNVFGVESFPRLYPICFLAYGVAGIVGPGIGGYLADYTGSYNTALYISAAIVFLAGVLATIKLDTFELKQLEGDVTPDEEVLISEDLKYNICSDTYKGLKASTSKAYPRASFQ